MLKTWWLSFEKNPRQCWMISILWLLLISWIGFFWNLGVLGVMDKTEALFVEVGHQVYLTNDWITPRWNWQTFFDYPIWGYWMVALSFKVFGVSTWAARFPAALTAIALVILSFYTLRYFGFNGEETELDTRQKWIRAWIGSGIVALNPGWVGWGRTSVTDMFLSGSIAMAMLSFFLGYAQADNPKVQQRWYLVAPVFAAIAVLAKGPIGILLPALSITVFLFYVGQFWQVLREMKLIPMIAIFLVITVPWYAAAAHVNGSEFVGTFFGFSNFQRFTSVLYRHAGPWYFYLPYCFILLFPWSLFLPLAIARLQFWRRKVWASTPRNRQLGLFCFVWFMVILVFFSAAATKLPGYILPIVPAGAMMITLFWGQEMLANQAKTYRQWPFLTSGIITTVLFFALAIAAFISPQLAGSDPAFPTFGETLAASGIPVIFGVALTLLSIASLILLIRKPYRPWFWTVNLGFFVALLTLVVPPLAPIMDSQRQQPFRELAREVGKVAKPQEWVFLMGYLRYSLVHYSQRRIEFFDDANFAIDFLKDPTKTNPLSTVLIVTEPKFMERFNLQPGDYQLIDEKGVYKLIRVSKSVLLERYPQK
ncbi:MAG: glycosyltransferase family 39 protein [Snowella sp.]|nr:glycosyltransferase family 39 protein [Snowella sp.]